MRKIKYEIFFDTEAFAVFERVIGEENGVYWIPPDDEEKEKVWICSPLHVTAQTSDDNHDNHGRLLEFKDPDGHRHAWVMPMRLLAGGGKKLRAILLSKGLYISTNRQAKKKLLEYLQWAQVDDRYIVTDQQK